MHVFPVETPRLRMRPICSADAALFEHLYTDAETMRFIGPPLSPERAAQSFRNALAGMQRQPIERLFLTVEEKATQTDVGICSLLDFDPEQRSVQAGVMFVASVRARGYSKEGFIGLIQQVFAELPVDELWVQFATDHVAVQRAVLSVGFVRRKDANRQYGTRTEGSGNGARNQPGMESGSAAADRPADGATGLATTAWAVYRHAWSPPIPQSVR
jgi:ribosomal-protein-alanine N-acetyltransferase